MDVKKYKTLQGKLTPRLQLFGKLHKGKYGDQGIATKPDILSLFHYKEETK